MEKVSVGRSVIVNDDNFIFCRRAYTVKQLADFVYVKKIVGTYYSKELELYFKTFKTSDYDFSLQTGDILEVIQECYTSNVGEGSVKSAFFLTVNGLHVAHREYYIAVLAAFEKTVRFIEELQ
jgi:hypothetical protein